MALLRRSRDRWDSIAKDAKAAERIMRTTATRGYAIRNRGMEALTSSIAVPIMSENAAIASICVTYVTSALSQREAVAQFLPRLQAAAAAIGTGISRNQLMDSNRARVQQR
jgi:DNA-binding IclR family transcriptional regulator